MLTSFVTPSNYKGLSASYVYDNQIDFTNKSICIDGNLSTFFSPIFLETHDFSNNNYSFLHLTKPLNLASITDFKTPEKLNNILFGTIYNPVDDVNRHLSLTNTPTPTPTGLSQLSFTQTMDVTLSGVANNCIFEVDMINPYLATISNLTTNNNRYYLSFNPSSLSLDFLVLSAFSASNDYTRKFVYTFDKTTRELTLQVRIRGFAYYIINDVNNRKLSLSSTSDIAFNSVRKGFYMDFFDVPTAPEITNDWGTYETGFNQNNLNINVADSFFGIDNNFLLHSEFENLEGSTLKTNILTLKNQLNIKNQQGRGNVFINENTTFYRNYNTIFSGRRQEQGYEKLHIQYDCYSTPYIFNQGKTTWFHTPQDMYPYKRLNIKSSKLVEAGAVAGNHPLKSDKIFKKQANYKYTSNQGDATGEQTGQWLCSWLSGGNDRNVRPVWVDRYYTPTKNTAFQALCAIDGNVTYITSFDGYNLKTGIVDIPSSLTLEPGCWYAYSRFGKIDAINNINSLAKTLKQKNFTYYSIWNGTNVDPIINENLTSYPFDGRRYSYFDVNNIRLDTNTFTMTLWANSSDWNKPLGYEIFGNYNDYGLGVFNYSQVTPLLFYGKNGAIVAYNADLDVVDTYDTALSTFGNINFVLRRDALNSFHVITDKMQVVEYDIRETIVDATPALSSSQYTIIHASNDEARGYILYSNRSLSAIDLTSNLVYPASANLIIGKPADALQVSRLLDGRIILVDGTNSIVRSDGLFFLSSGIICKYNTTTSQLCTVAGTKGTFSFFNIDRDNNIWAGDSNFIAVYGPHQALTFTTTLVAASAFSTQPISIKNVTFIENFYNGELEQSVLVTASGSDVSKAVGFKLDYYGNVIDTTFIDVNGSFNTKIEPCNHNFNYSYLKYRYGTGVLTFKARLYNQFNTEDIAIPSVTVQGSDLDSGYHHFAIALNPPAGTLKLYLDGELYGTTSFEPNKYNFMPLLTDRVFAGATPYYNGLLLSDYLDKAKSIKTSYFVKDFEIQNFYLYNRELDYFDVGMHYKERIMPNDLTFDMPSGKRNFLDIASRYFKQGVPGAKSTLYNIYINDNVLDNTCRDRLNVAIINKIKDITPAYSKLNNLKWITTLPSQSATYLQPYFPGNTLTNAGRRNE